MVQLGLQHVPVLLSDSSPDQGTVDAASEWASTAGCRLVIDHSDKCRSLKQALNMASASCETDVTVVTVADVVVSPARLGHLIQPICVLDSADVVHGVAASDPSVTGLRHRADAFQLDTVPRLTRTGGSSMRAKGALWAAHRRFYAKWRFPIASGGFPSRRAASTTTWSWPERSKSEGFGVRRWPTRWS